MTYSEISLRQSLALLAAAQLEPYEEGDRTLLLLEAEQLRRRICDFLLKHQRDEK